MTARAGNSPAPLALPCALSPVAGECTDHSEACWALYRSGYTAGLDAGRKAADEELATLQREAVAVVRELAGIPPRDRAVDRAARERRDAHFAGIASRGHQAAIGGPTRGAGMGA